MSDASFYALLSTAGATALFHTLIPDHWLPFVLIGRARGWPTRIVAVVSGASALIHVVLSVLLALGALVMGLTVTQFLGETLHQAGAGLLVVFGLGYAIWAWRKGGHFHPGGRRIHGEVPGICDGGEGPGHPQHLHYHADAALIEDQPGWTAVGLAVIVGLNPCVLFLPILLASAAGGPAAVALVTLAYAVPTVLLMVGLSVLGVRAGGQMRLPLAARHMEALSGLLVAALGVLFLFIRD